MFIKVVLSLSEMITDLDFDSNSALTISRDKKINLYSIKFV
jgi:hypothetical protein